MGLDSFFLFLMPMTSVVWIAKRQDGLQRWLPKVLKEGFNMDYHVVLGRYLMIPIIIIALTGVDLSLEKFDVLPTTKISHSFPDGENMDIKPPSLSEIAIFKQLKLGVKTLEFPFSVASEDYFFVKVKDRDLYVNQFSGEIVSEQKYPITQKASHWSLLLHMGLGSILWSLIIGSACVALIFYIYSRFGISLKRTKKSTDFKNTFGKDEAEYIILVGSETGNTYSFASLFLEALLKEGKTAFLGSMNEFSTFENAKELIIFTATHGEGEAPSNAEDFEDLVENFSQSHELKYSVLGFGSLLYPDYCQFAIDVDEMLQKTSHFSEKLELVKINNQSHEAFKHWTTKWSGSEGFWLNIQPIPTRADKKQGKPFKVVKKTALNPDDSFLLQLKPQKRTKFESGDLLAFKLNDDEAVRLYSVGKLNGDILLSVKKHDQGLCSRYLFQLNAQDNLEATIQRNYDFHFPRYAKEVIMIANGTGIAPFLGMINEHHENTNLHLFWGGRTRASFDMYKAIIYQAFEKNELSSINMAFSKENEQKIYVQDLIVDRADFIAKHLKNEGVIMICGSIAMQNRVLETLQHISKTKLDQPLSDFENREQIRMDCY